MSDCFFEYPARWSQLYEYLLSGDDARVKQALAHLEARDRALEDHLRNRPCGGGGAVEILGRSGCFLGLVGSGPYVATEPIEVELSARSTIRVSGMCMVANATTLEVVPYAANTSSYQRPVWRSTTATAELHSAHISYVVTLDAGTHELGFTARSDSPDGSAYGIDLVIGPNTETWTPDNCLG